MELKSITKSILIAMLAASLANCDSDVDNPQASRSIVYLDEDSIADPIYFQLCVGWGDDTPNASRADTYEESNDSESTIYSLDLIFFTYDAYQSLYTNFDQNFHPIAYKRFEGNLRRTTVYNSTLGKNLTAYKTPTFGFDRKLIADNVNPTSQSNDGMLYYTVRCNMPAMTEDELNNFSFSRVLEFDEDTNNPYKPKRLFSTISSYLLSAFFIPYYVYENYYKPKGSTYSTANQAYSLGTITTIPHVARIDYKDGGENADNVFEVGTDCGNGLVNIKFTEMALFNMSRYWYEFYPHVDSSTGKTDTTCDPYTAEKSQYNASSTTDLSHLFVYPYNDPTTWQFDKIDDLDTEDSDDTWNSSGAEGDYKIWRYCTENIIQPTNTSYTAFFRGICTGVCFKAKFQPLEENSEIAQAMATGESLYVYADKMFGSWDMVEDAMSTNIYGLKEAHDASYDVNDQYSDDLAEAAGFTIYKPDKDGNYYSYYYYWIRETDNNYNTIQGKQEFGILRNHVYKLAITKVSKFGQPTLTHPDDEHENVEPDDMYLSLMISISSWAVIVDTFDL